MEKTLGMTMDEKKGRHEDEDKKRVYLAVYASDDCTKLSWIKIDSSDGTIRFDQVQKMDIPEHLELHKFCGSACVSSGSKVYFISGEYRYPYSNWASSVDPDPYSSDEVFTYDLNSQTWDLHKNKLNVARSSPIALLIPNRSCIYVFGGKIPYEHRHRKNWIEWYNLRDETSGWQFVEKKSYPPPDLFKHGDCIMWHALDEPRSRVLIYVNDQYGFLKLYSFYYDEKTWRELSVKNFGRPCNLVSETQLSLEQDLLIWNCWGTIWGYDLSSETIVLKHSIQNLGDRFVIEKGEEFRYYPPTLHVLRVAKNVLLLLWGEYVQEEPFQHYSFFCCRYRIEKKNPMSEIPSNGSSSSASKKKVSLCYELVLDGSQSYNPAGFSFHTCFLV